MKRLPTFLLLFFISLGVVAKTPEITKSPLDKRDYGYIELENGLKVVVVSDPLAKSSAAAMVVHAGSFDEPNSHLGLAHYLEHMLFLGTKKFPTADEFQNFVSRHGGTYNATTQSEKTTFFFNIQPENISDALERFSDFFIAPLFNEQLMERELHAVDSEFHLNHNQDGHALLEVAKETSNPSHPFYRFSAGNLQTLKMEDNLYAAVKAFYKKHYHAKNMTLTIVGPQSKAKLTALAKQYFSPIRTQEVIKPNRPLVFQREQLGLDISMRSRSQARELVIEFPIIVDNKQAFEKPGQLVSMLLGYEGQGSLANQLKKLKWVSSLSTNYDEITQEQDLLVFHFNLTPQGIRHIDDITQMTFAYIQFLKQKGIPEYFFDELSTMSQWDFHFAIQDEPMDFALTLANRIDQYPISKLLTANFYLKGEVLPSKQISELLNQLSPRNMRRIVLSPEVKTDKATKWYQAAYKVKPLTEHQIKRFIHPRINAQFELPHKNIYLPQKLALLQQIRDPDQPPEKIELEGTTLWYHQNTLFEMPRSNIVVNIAFSDEKLSPHSSLLSDLYVAYASDVLLETFYPAQVAGASVAMNAHANGIAISLSSYSDKQDVLLQQVLQTLKHLKISKDDFNSLLSRRVVDLNNFKQMSLYQQALSDLNILLYMPAWHPDELLKAAEYVKHEQLNQYVSSIWQSPKIDILVHGNVNKRHALQFAQMLQLYFPKTQTKAQKNKAKIVKLAQNKTWYRSIPSNNENHVLVWYLQNAKTDYNTMAKTVLLAKMLETPYFQSLRTQQQLGYALQATPFMIDKVSGLVFWIQSSKRGSKHLYTQTKTFLEDYQKSMTALTEQDILPFREAIVQNLRQDPLSLDEETQRLWAPIQRGDLEFDRAEKLSDAVEKISLQELRDFAKECLANTKGQLLVMSTPPATLPKQDVVPSVSAFKNQGEYFTLG